MKFLGIIPARYASTRFPGKPLAMLGGKPMIQRVYERASLALEAVVATDDRRIYDAVKAFGGNVVMTSDAHRSGTDRCREAYDNFGVEADVVINIQGDEPFIDPMQIELLKNCFTDPSVDIATLVRPFDQSRGYEALEDPNTPKVVVADNGDALYFSRSVVPYVRGREREEWPRLHSYFTHVGVYAFRTDVLRRVVVLPQSPLEIAESLEQLRWLQGGYRIRTAVTTSPTVGIDTPSDLASAEKMLEIDRTVAPPTVDCAPVRIQPQSVETLSNGIRFHVVNYGEQEIMRMVLFGQGGLAESTSKAAYKVAMDALCEATRSISAEDLADIVDFNGARLNSRSDTHFSGIDLLVLNSRLEDLLPVVKSVITESLEAEKAVEVSKRKLATSAATARGKVDTRASDRLKELMLGVDNPAAEVVLPEAFEKVTRRQCVKEYEVFPRGITHAFIGGALSPETVATVKRFLESLPGSDPREVNAVAATPAPPCTEHIEMPDTLQWAVAMGLPAIRRDHPDYNALRLAVVALGGYFGSRLMKNIREEKGLTYGISSALIGSREGSYVEILAQCDGRYVEQLIAETRSEMARLAENPPVGDELRRLRLFVWSQLTASADSALGTLQYYITRLTVDTPVDYFEAQLKEIEHLTPERIAEVARKYLDPSKLTVVTAGAK